MAYLRGDTYIYASNLGVHFWNKNGKEDLSAFEWSDENPEAGGVRIGFNEADEFAILRFAEMLSEKDQTKLLSEILRICAENHNFGANSLKKNKDKLLRLIRSYDEK